MDPRIISQALASSLWPRSSEASSPVKTFGSPTIDSGIDARPARSIPFSTARTGAPSTNMPTHPPYRMMAVATPAGNEIGASTSRLAGMTSAEAINSQGAGHKRSRYRVIGSSHSYFCTTLDT